MVRCRPILGLSPASGAYLNKLHILGMERPAYNNFPKNRNGPGYGGQNQECRDGSRRIICKLRGERYRNPGNEWLAKFIQEELYQRSSQVGLPRCTLPQPADARS